MAYVVWAIYSTIARGPDAGLGVVVAWPTLLLALALIAAPFAAVAFLGVKIRDRRRPPQSLSDLKLETITDLTFPS